MTDVAARSDGEQRRIGTTFTDEEIARMDRWGFSKMIRSRSEVIRQLVRIGLEAEESAATGVQSPNEPPAAAGATTA